MKYVLLVSGHMRCGKNQLSEFLKNGFENKNKSVATDYFARSLKDNCKEDFKNIADYLNSETENIKTMIKMFLDVTRYPERRTTIEAIENKLDQMKLENHNFYEEKTTLSRMLLQIYGTEIFRKRVDDDWWAKQTRDRVFGNESDISIITDVRFLNEIEVFYKDTPKDYKVLTIRVNRNLDSNNKVALHESETALDEYEVWDYVVENDGSIEDLQLSANTIVDDIFKNNINESTYLFV